MTKMICYNHQCENDMIKKRDSKKRDSPKKKCPPCKKGKPQRDSRGRCRCYEDEYERDHKSKKAKQDRSSRTRARKKVSDWYTARGKKLSSDLDIDHKDGNPRNNASGNLRTMPIGENRGRSNGDRTRKA